MAISKRLRYEILRRDGHRCRYCGVTAAEVKITVDHVVPEALGGSSDPSNLAAACGACNSGKTSTSPDAPLVAGVAADALRWSRAMTVAADEMRARVIANKRTLEWFDDAWAADLGEWCTRPDDWPRSVTNFLAAGLPMDILEQCIAIAKVSRVSNHQKWRYMCGVAWSRISDLQKHARRITSDATSDQGEEELSDTERAVRKDLACEMLGDLPEEDRKAAIALAREILPDDDEPEVMAVIGEFYSAVRERKQFADAVRWFMERHPDGPSLLSKARTHLESLGTCTEIDVARVSSLWLTEAAPVPIEVP